MQIPLAGYAAWKNTPCGHLYLPQGYNPDLDELQVFVAGWFDAHYIDRSYCSMNIPSGAFEGAKPVGESAMEPDSYVVEIPLPADFSHRELSKDHWVSGYVPPASAVDTGRVSMSVSHYVGGWNPFRVLMRVHRREGAKAHARAEPGEEVNTTQALGAYALTDFAGSTSPFDLGVGGADPVPSHMMEFEDEGEGEEDDEGEAMMHAFD